ncbi:hypothetical protein CBF34_00305 [Vagococcus penaei]|uniref:Uncharacterized protein n=2 Tax=Vagococcus penaei TaxID=633807 RepID=A0A1Q2D8U0_9ENTE|nr:hypothetical protein BW732_04385 [Vagococcus penaei]RSU07585.1 hypothetical protein CBF34_00305 [Vagococcus penaei]
MFGQKEFDCFKIEGLEARMTAIRAYIQPLFQELDDYFVGQLAPELGSILPVHIAQHRRRTANAPDFTWSAMGGDQRGYKKYPHFQLGITENYLVMWLSFIDNPQFEQAMADDFLLHPELFTDLEADMVINLDHTKNTYELLTVDNLKAGLTRWQTVKKGEFQIGRIIKKENPLLSTPDLAREYMLETYQQLVPLYLRAMQIRQDSLAMQ